MGIDYYAVLNLKKHCTQEEVCKAFGKHISKYSVANKQNDPGLILLCEAYEVLSDSLRRTLFDQYGEEGVKFGVHSDSFNIDPWKFHGNVITTYIEYCATNKNLAPCWQIKPIEHPPEKSNASNYIFDVIKLPLKLTLNEIYNGSTKMVAVKRHHIIVESKDVDEMKTIKVKVPRGIVTGGSIVTEVMHTETESHNVKTTYIFKTEEIPHKYFKRENLNLILWKELSLKEAICGIKMHFKTLDHKVLRVNITQVITPDYTKIIHGEGMPDANDPSKYGDIIIKFQINYPIFGAIMDKEFLKIFKPLTKSNNTVISEDKKNACAKITTFNS